MSQTISRMSNPILRRSVRAIKGIRGSYVVEVLFPGRVWREVDGRVEQGGGGRRARTVDTVLLGGRVQRPRLLRGTIQPDRVFRLLLKRILNCKATPLTQTERCHLRSETP